MSLKDAKMPGQTAGQTMLGYQASAAASEIPWQFCLGICRNIISYTVVPKQCLDTTSAAVIHRLQFQLHRVSDAVVGNRASFTETDIHVTFIYSPLVGLLLCITDFKICCFTICTKNLKRQTK